MLIDMIAKLFKSAYLLDSEQCVFLVSKTD